jgi:predicted site-specific integrase-resolvase
LGVHVDTLRAWERRGRIRAERVNARGDRRFHKRDLDCLLRSGNEERERAGLYVRVSGSSGQESSLAAQESELRELGAGGEVRVFRDRASGLNERRRGLTNLLGAAERGELDVVRVTHRDRLTRFGFGLVERLLGAYGVRVEVLHDDVEQSSEQELMSDFMSLIASFSGRVYGQRSAEARKRLLKEAEEQVRVEVRS